MHIHKKLKGEETMKKTISILLAFIMLLSLTACGAKRESAEAIAEKAIKAAQSADPEQIAQYWSGSQPDDSDLSDFDAECLKAMLKNLTYEIVSSEEKETTATVTVKFTNIDIGAAFSDTLQTAFAQAIANAFGAATAEDYDEDTFVNEELLKNLNSGNYENVTKEAVMKLHFADDQWVMDEDNEEAFDAMFAGLYSMLESLDESEDSEQAIIDEARDWLVGDIWNDGICDMSHYYEDGKSATGATLDPDFTLKQLAKAMEKKADYDSQMAALSEEYSEISELWAKVSEQVDILYAEIQARGTEVTGSSLDTGLYNQYFDAFDDAYFELS